MSKVRIFRIGGLEEDGTSSYGPWLAEGILCPVKAGDYYPAADVERLVEASRSAIKLIEKYDDILGMPVVKVNLRAALKPFKEVPHE